MAFLQRPEKYAPVNRGECPVTQVDGGAIKPGHAKWGVLYNGHLFLCADAAGRDLFLKTPGRYAAVDLASREACPHCRGSAGERLATSPGQVAGSPPPRRSSLPTPPALLEAFLTPVSRLWR